MSHRARKRFGQNFLCDMGVIDEMIGLIDPKPSDRLVEIGPGQGALTRRLLGRAGHLDVIEIDRDLVQLLQKEFVGASGLVIHENDALDFDFASLLPQGSGSKLRIIGNLPYNISTPLIFHVLEFMSLVQDMHFMLQKEVVERIAALPGNKQYGRLSLMVQARCQVDVLLEVPPEAFRPVPKVDSAVFRLTPRFHPGVDHALIPYLEQVVSQAFAQRRKLVRNNLKSLLKPDAMDAARVAEMARPEQLTLDQYVMLARALAQA